MIRLRRKIDRFLVDWKNSKNGLTLTVKEEYSLYFYKSERGVIEMDFFIKDNNSLIIVEVKANDNVTIFMNNLIKRKKFQDIKHDIKLSNKNIGFNGKFYTFPYFLTFLLKRYLKAKKDI